MVPTEDTMRIYTNGQMHEPTEGNRHSTGRTGTSTRNSADGLKISCNVLFRMCPGDINDFLHFIITAHEDSRPIVDMLRHDLEHPAHITGNSLTTG
jgi:hypothetical protein